MSTTIFVISDLHLGGEPGPKGSPGFQMCPPANQARLAQFIESLPARQPEKDVRLVLAGDVVDFLAEREWAAFTLDKNEAQTKLQRIIDQTQLVWTALKGFIARGGALTLMLGNHDIELCLPGVRHLLLETLGEGRIEFLYDNEAFSFGPVLIEHGNRYDEWNAVPHGALRRVRSQLSRGMSAQFFPMLPGSQLVVEVMNRLKADYSFIDLLKPEDAGVLPIVAALGAGSVRDIWQGFRKYLQTREIEFDDNRQPLDETFIAAPNDRDQQMFDLAEDIAAGGDATQVSAVSDLWQGARAAVSATVREYRRKALFKALRGLVDHHRLTFDVEVENSLYLTGAKTSAACGYAVIVYGHTHLAKRVPLESEKNLPVYLNTGAWADLMRIPDAVWAETEDAARSVLDKFVADLESDNVAQWRRAAPTFAKIEVAGNQVVSADVYFADGDNDERVTTVGLLKRLAPEVNNG